MGATIQTGRSRQLAVSGMREAHRMVQTISAWEDTMERCLKLVLASGLLAGLLVVSQAAAQGQTKSPASVTPADYLRWRTEFKNWGRWGPNDERGTTNLI